MSENPLFIIAGAPVIIATPHRIGKEEQMEGLHYYNIRWSEETWEPYILQRNVWHCHHGTIATSKPIALFEENKDNPSFRGYELTEGDIANINTFI